MKSSTAKTGTQSGQTFSGDVEGAANSKPLFEGLEGRRMMSTVELNGGVLTIAGHTDSPNTVSLTLNEAKTRLTAAANAVVQEYNLADVTSIHITGGSHSDAINISTDIDVSAWIDAGAGDDFVAGGSGNDTIFGGTGNDTLQGMAGFDEIHGNEGNDRLSGGRNSDTLYGGSGNDILFGRLGKDMLYGGIGADIVWGGRGDDTLAGGTGQDHIDGKLGNNTVTDGADVDIVLNATPPVGAANPGTDTGTPGTGGAGTGTGGTDTGTDGTDTGTGGTDTGTDGTDTGTGGTDTGNGGTDTGTGGTDTDTGGTDPGTGGTGTGGTGGGGTGTDDPGTDQTPVVPGVVSLSWVNADTNQTISPLTAGSVVDLRTIPTLHLNMLANLEGGTVGSVRFSIDGSSTYQIDNDAGYTLNRTWTPTIGAHSVTVTPFSGANATGTAGEGKTITFTVVDTTVVNPVPTNNLPTVRIINPLDSSTKVGPAQYVIRATAADSDGSVSKVEFYAGNTLIGMTNDQPYSIAWTDVLPGTYRLTARAYDNDGAAATSTVVTITVKAFTTRNTYYVSPTGNDSNAGSVNSPLRTISKAANLAGAGDTVLINPGTYRESVWLSKSGTSDKPITFKAVTPGTVVIDGADVVSGWSADSGAIYSAAWAHDFIMAGSRTWGINEGTSGYAEQFMVGNTMLTRVAGKANLRAGSFAIDYNTDKVYVWLPGSADARTTQVMGSTRSTLFAPASTVLNTAANVRVEGLTFRHAANFMQNQQAAVRTDNGWVMVDSTVQYTNSTGLGVMGTDVTVLRVTSEFNGQNGIGSSSGKNVLVKDSASRGNNVRNVDVDWEAGGGKWARTDGVYMLNYSAYQNKGIGIWYDIENTNFVVKNCSVWGNVGVSKIDQGVGIMMEISPGPARIEGNSVHDQSGPGIRIAESMNVIVQDNTLVNNYRGVELRNMPNRDRSILNVTVRNNRIRGWSEAAIGTQQGTWNATTASAKNIKIEGNTYDFTGSSTARIWHWGTSTYLTLNQVQSVLGFDRTGVMGAVAA